MVFFFSRYVSWLWEQQRCVHVYPAGNDSHGIGHLPNDWNLLFCLKLFDTSAEVKYGEV